MAGRYAVDDGKPLPPVGTRGAGKHQSAVLLQAREAIDAGRYASEHEAAEAFYEEYSGRRVSDEKTEPDVLRHTETTKKMRAKLRRMAPKEVKEGA
jgi:hypothetical protein